MSERGLLIILSGSSGVEKGTVRKTIFDSEENDFQHSISMAIRKQREDEMDGVDYYFRLKEGLEAMTEVGEMLGYAEYVGNCYGIPLTYVNQTLDEGRGIFLGTGAQGAKRIKDKMPNGVFIFLTPPDLAELELRIIGRGTSEMSVIEERMTVTRKGIEMMALYDYAVVNDEIPLAIQRIRGTVAGEHFRVGRIIGEYIKMLEEM